jgi:hypothetical protein
MKKLAEIPGRRHELGEVRDGKEANIVITTAFILSLDLYQKNLGQLLGFSSI